MSRSCVPVNVSLNHKVSFKLRYPQFYKMRLIAQRAESQELLKEKKEVIKIRHIEKNWMLK